MSDSNIEHARLDRETGQAPATGLTLDAFAVRAACTEGIWINSLEAGTVVTVHTRHSRYRVVVLDRVERRALVSGGTVLPSNTEVRVEGATAGGSMVKIGWIGVGLRLEVSIGRRRITTSRVLAVSVEDIRSLTPISDRAH